MKEYMKDKKIDRLAWIDLEMSGLDVDHDCILEAGCVITDAQLNIIDQIGPFFIAQPAEVLDGMSEWCKLHHNQSGLLVELATATDTVESVQEKLLVFVAKHCALQQVPLCGNSVWVDRLFLRKNMPKLESYFHYRIVDVSTLKILANCWFGMTKDDFVPKKNCHRVMDDIVESIEELKQYRARLFK